MSADALLPIDRFVATLAVVAKEAEHLEWSRNRLFAETIDEDWGEGLNDWE